MGLTFKFVKVEAKFLLALAENSMLWCHNLEATKRGKFSSTK